MTTEKRHTHGERSRLAHATVIALLGSAIVLGGCVLEPPGPSLISRLPADQSGVPATAPSLTPEQRERYDAIDRQVLAEQDLAMAREAAAQAWARAYSPPVTLYGGYFGGWRGPGWGGWGWGGGPGWGMGWGW